VIRFCAESAKHRQYEGEQCESGCHTGASVPDPATSMREVERGSDLDGCLRAMRTIVAARAVATTSCRLRGLSANKLHSTYPSEKSTLSTTR
jgi:hypothetical protein